MEMNVQAAEQAAAAAAAGLPLMQGNGVYMPEWGHGQTPEWAQTALQPVSLKPCDRHMLAPTCHPKQLVAGNAASGPSLSAGWVWQEVPPHAFPLPCPASHGLQTVQCLPLGACCISPLHSHVPAGIRLSSAIPFPAPPTIPLVPMHQAPARPTCPHVSSAAHEPESAISLTTKKPVEPC